MNQKDITMNSGWTPGPWGVALMWAGTWMAYEIVSYTKATAMVRVPGWTRAFRMSREKFVFTGSEGDATALAEVLNSLEGRRKAAERQLREQHSARVANAIADANPNREEG